LLLKRHEPLAKRLSREEPLSLQAAIGADHNGHIFGGLVVVARFHAERHLITFVKPHHRIPLDQHQLGLTSAQVSVNTPNESTKISSAGMGPPCQSFVICEPGRAGTRRQRDRVMTSDQSSTGGPRTEYDA